MKKLFVVLIFTLFIASSLKSQSTRDSLLQKLSVANNDSIRYDALWELSEVYLSEKPDSSLLLANQALTLAKKLRNSAHEAAMLFTIGKIYKEKGDYLSALKYYNISRAIYEEGNHEFGVASNMLYTGEIHGYLGDQALSLESYFNAKDIYQRIDSAYGLAVSLVKISDLYRQLEKYDSALYYLNQISVLKQYPLYIEAELGGRVKQAYADIYMQKGEDSIAMIYYRESIHPLQKAQWSREICRVWLSMAQLFQKKGLLDSSSHYAMLSFNFARSAGFMLEVFNSSEFLARYNKSVGKYREANEFVEISLAAKETLFSQEKNKAIQSYLFKEESQKQREESERKILLLLAASTVFLIIAFLLWRNNKQKQKANALLQQQKQEVQQALTELKAVQQQLIHAEKMASLGEVTAGIAHEIQNPLNFVNNFSEISAELVGELRQELEEGRTAEAAAILDDLGISLQKINHHGNRADAIVKNMLQHSRQNAGEKLMVDINAMVDEYLRLSYQAVLTKEKVFNATLETHFDKNIGSVSMVPQDMGRVLLNLFNNAFYAVREKAKKATNIYEPVVHVSTRRVNGGFEIRVRDNGTGIPAKAVEKIYQPFFTTKPTGEGTGLGLSMSYDIITKIHGGKMSVDTKEGEYAEFVVELPVH